MNPLVAVPAVTFLALATKRHLSRRSPKPALDDETSKKPALGAETGKKGTLHITHPDWQWPIYDEFTDQFGQVLELKRRTAVTSDDEAASGPFRVVYRNNRNQLWPDAVQIILPSRSLCKIVGLYLPDDGDLKTLAEPKISGRQLYIVLAALKNHILSSNGGGKLENQGLANGSGGLKRDDIAHGNLLKTRNGDGAGDDCDAGEEMEEEEVHLKHLVRFMETEYRDVPVRVKRMQEEKRVAWDMLWAFLSNGKKVVYSCDHSQERLCAVVSNSYYQSVMNEGWLFLPELDIWEFDGLSYKKCQIRRIIRKYEGERSFPSLAVCPIEIFGTPEMLEERFLQNGNKYHDLTMTSTHRFMHYTGPMFQQRQVGSCWQVFKEKADGRVMIDQTSFAKMNPDYPMGNAQPPTASAFWVCQDDDFQFQFCALLESLDSSLLLR